MTSDLVTPNGNTAFMTGGGGYGEGGYGAMLAPLYLVLGLAFANGFGNNNNMNLSTEIAQQTSAIQNSVFNATSTLAGLTNQDIIATLQGNTALSAQICSEGRNTDSNIFGAVSTLSNQNFASEITNLNNFNNINSNIFQTSCDIKGVVHAEGDKTRALINAIDRDNLNRIIVNQNAEIVELKGDRRHSETDAKINQLAVIVNNLSGVVGSLTNTINQIPVVTP